MTKLQVSWGINGSRQSRDITEHNYLLIGRQPECDIILNDPYVSRRHAVIFFHNGTFRIHNLSNTNPIIVNESWRVAQNQNVPLNTGDSLEFGSTKMSVGLV